MIDTFKIVKKIEMIYREINLSETINKKLTKRKFMLIVLPKIGCIISFCFIIIFTFIIKCPVIQFISLISYVLLILLTLKFNKKYLEIKYGIYEDDDEIFYYRLFKENILKNNITKEELIMVKNISEIEMKKEINDLSIYFTGYFSSILLPSLFIIFEEYIKTNIKISIYMVLSAFFFPLIAYIFNMIFKRKDNTKKFILKKIERIILEL